MHLSSRTDIEAPIEHVYKVMSDFENWERAAMRRGADVSRTDKLRAPGVGMGWHVIFRFRGKERAIDIYLTEQEPGAKLAFKGKGRMVEGDLSIELVSLAPKRTRMVLHTQVRPLTIAARLFLQSLKLAKGRVQGKLNKRMEQLAIDIETRFNGARGR
ncbi:MAG: SRPBCC family protein [Pseudotabrizicola sp.]|uniref:SRPBCC family protein n=1 Tax=Pseudotabrizicola sp. TaxID=2939647 RepID=UPI00271C7E94|nr:SRPBCC family protein [Pseudotabrizicola sp.]MDO8881880.1 SRPBCC family protein [Pseudotabrizicola sp.]MDP2082239.1 SRPBCC family protein [Pseudotabrizicola sp.]MDZ7575159.1 SRPBCC family protein [Pseudotabrizicola sp.]